MAKITQQSILRISDEKTLQLIELYENEECLWNTTTEAYKIKSKRYEAAERIAKILNLKHFTFRHVIIKFKNLRNSYCQELKKIANSVAAGEEPVYRPRVFWFSKMDSFLRPHLQPTRDSKLLFNYGVLVKSEPEENEESQQSRAVTDDNNSCSEEDAEEYLLRVKRSRNSSMSFNESKLEESYSNTYVPSSRDTSSHQPTTSHRDDCYDSFGKYVSAMLRNMPEQRAMELQPQIVKLLVLGTIGTSEGLVSQSDEKSSL
ncbi:uncharacterized protein LOC125069673 [Vanessa atalanta]|uniref:uncharacterized protein LOC125069673 n=1 Tax=Vanessa atalanta TaxID=42275 RepID=UPI001FCD5573|nr:uncharacterized protein LOC125069673 [Vanessa atalanta]